MLTELMNGRALTARELADVARITPQTASSHLSRLVAAGLLRVNQQGRHRYHRLSGPQVARMLEGIMQIASANDIEARRTRALGSKDAALNAARTCYDHLAGRLGVAITDRLIALGAIELDDDAGLVTEEGAALFTSIGIDLPKSQNKAPGSSRPICRPCIDWSERRPHVAGKLGAAICTHCLEKGWVRRRKGTRALDVTREGAVALRDLLGLY